MHTTITIVLAEISLVLIVVLVVIGVRTFRCRRREKEAVDTLVTSIKTHQSERVKNLVGMLKEGGQLNDEDALEKANELIKKQNKFYQDAIDLYFTRNHQVLSKLDTRIDELLSQYQVMVTVTDGDNPPAVDTEMVDKLSKDIAALSKDIESLRSENAELTNQLKAAEHELDQLGREYVSAFNKPKDTKAKGEKEGEEAAEDESAEGKEAIEGQEEQPQQEQQQETQEESQEEPMAPVEEQAAEQVEEQIAEEGLIEPESPEEEVKDEPQTKVPASAGEPDDTATEDAEPPVLEEAQIVEGEKQPEPEMDPSEDDGEDKGMLTDLDLEELLGEQPGEKKKSDDKD